MLMVQGGSVNGNDRTIECQDGRVGLQDPSDPLGCHHMVPLWLERRTYSSQLGSPEGWSCAANCNNSDGG